MRGFFALGKGAPYDRVAVVCKSSKFPRWLLLGPAALIGCATANPNRPAVTTASGAEPDSAMARLEQGAEDQTRRIAELETRLSLLEQEARTWRESAVSKHAETIRIGASRREAEAEPEPAQLPVRLVRLHEAAPAEPLVLPAMPVGIAAKLPVAPLPEDRVGRSSTVEDVGPDGAPREAYRAAVRLVSERHWNEALVALNQFLEQHPSGPTAANALYWRGEVYYGLRRYDDALREFQGLLSRFPACSKAADSLLKLGMCHLRLGDQAMAQRYFRQVREQYPSSDAARIASREGSS